jgi:hypothetical protein
VPNDYGSSASPSGASQTGSGSGTDMGRSGMAGSGM